MQMSTRYAALGVDIQMRQHNIIAVIVWWSIPEKKKNVQFSTSANVSTSSTRRLVKFPDVGRHPNTHSHVLYLSGIIKQPGFIF
jgi:hypothetical protein